MMALLLMTTIPVLGAGVVFTHQNNRTRPRILVLVALSHMGIVSWLWLSGAMPTLGRWLILDSIGKIVLSLISLLYLGAALYTIGYLEKRLERNNKYFIVSLLFFLSAVTVVTLSQHFGLLWIALEATTLASAPLLYFNHNQRSLEATWKYLIICSVGIALALLGIFFLAMAETSSGPIEDPLFLPTMLQHGSLFSIPWLRAAFIFLLVGFGTKMGLAPMHTWKPDAYGEAPGVVGFLMSGALTSCAFLALVRITQVCQAAQQLDFARPLFILTGLLSMGVAAVFMLGQQDYKRMLAYSSVEHMGILTLALGLGGLAIYGALLHLLSNGLAKGVLFLTAGNIHRHYGSKSVSSVQGVFRRLPVSGALFMAGFIAITGSPPFGIFVSEFTILRSAMADGRWIITALFLGFLALIFVGMGRIVLSMTQGESTTKPEMGARESWLTILTPCFLISLVFLLGIYIPAWLDGPLQMAAQLLGGHR